MATLVINHASKHAGSAEHPHEHQPAPLDTAPSAERVAMPPVTVNGVTISRKAIAAEVQNFPARNPGEGWRAATRALVIRQLLLDEARRLDITMEQKPDEDGRKETAEDALVRALVEREVQVPEADEATLRAPWPGAGAAPPGASAPRTGAPLSGPSPPGDDGVAVRCSDPISASLASLLTIIAVEC